MGKNAGRNCYMATRYKTCKWWCIYFNNYETPSPLEIIEQEWRISHPFPCRGDKGAHFARVEPSKSMERRKERKGQGFFTLCTFIAKLDACERKHFFMVGSQGQFGQTKVVLCDYGITTRGGDPHLTVKRNASDRRPPRTQLRQ